MKLHRIWYAGRLSALLVCMALVASGCARIENIGRPPAMSPSGGPEGAEPLITPARASLAAPDIARSAAYAPTPSRPSPAIGARAAPAARASLWRSGPSSLFGDRRAQGRGDILTVVIEIDEEAAISNATDRRRGASEDLAVGALLGLPKLVDDVTGVDLGNAAQLSSASSSSGDGSVRRTEEITLRLAATVAEVLPNGHFVIAGSQEVRVNFELRELRVQGVVRPEDISRGNEITYDKIADARVSYGGRGQITDVQQPRYGQQIADIILPF